MSSTDKAADAPTGSKGKPTPSQKQPPERSAKTEDRIALLQWAIVAAVLLAGVVVAVMVLGPGEGGGGGGGGHGNGF